MLNKQWNVLLVDDEPDVLAVSKLALKRLTVYGLPIRVFEAKSKAEAIAFLTDDPEGAHLAAAIVDVVMESDAAGLELCAHIREVFRNPNVNIVVRTGQPGTAPERDVVDRYDISGYLSKVDATDQRLYSIVKGSIRQYFNASSSYAHAFMLRRLAGGAHSRAAFLARQKEVMMASHHDAKGRRVSSIGDTAAWISGDHFVGTGDWEKSELGLKALQVLRDSRQRLASDGMGGDKLALAGGNALLSLNAGAEPPVDVIWRLAGDPTLLPQTAVVGFLNYQRAVRTLWTLAGRNG